MTSNKQFTTSQNLPKLSMSHLKLIWELRAQEDQKSAQIYHEGKWESIDYLVAQQEIETKNLRAIYDQFTIQDHFEYEPMYEAFYEALNYPGTFNS